MQANDFVWFSNMVSEVKLQVSDFTIFEELVTSSFNSDQFNPNNLKIDDYAPRIIFISVSQVNISATVIHGTGYGLIAALEDAFLKVQQRFDLKANKYIIKLDIVTKSRIHNNYSEDEKLDFVLGLEGVAFSDESDLAILPEQISHNYLWDSDRKMLKNRLYNYLEKNPPETLKLSNVLRNKKFDIYIFSTESFLVEPKKLVPLYRGQLRFESFSRKELKESISLAGKYLINAIAPNGRFDYQYHVDANFSARDYNFLRHAGTCFALAEYLEFSQDPKCLPALKTALEYMKLFKAPGLEDPTTTCFIERGLVKVGGNGLAALALAKYIAISGDESDKELLREICNWILTQTKGDGNFKGHKQYYHNGKYSTETVLYYPGEVIYGLVSAYSLLKEEKWLETANRIAHWMINIRDQGIEMIDLEHDHWLLYGLNALYRFSPNQLYIEHSAKICHAIIYRQVLKSEYPDYFGAHNNYGYPSSTQTATRSEGLLAAYKLLRDFGNSSKFTQKVFESAKRCVAFQLKTQYNPINCMYIHDAKRALGGFRASIAEHDVRIDYVQHNLSSLISLYKILSEEYKELKEEEQIALYIPNKLK